MHFGMSWYNLGKIIRGNAFRSSGPKITRRDVYRISSVKIHDATHRCSISNMKNFQHSKLSNINTVQFNLSKYPKDSSENCNNVYQYILDKICEIVEIPYSNPKFFRVASVWGALFVLCTDNDHHGMNEKRLFRAAKYGNVQEIKRLHSEGMDVNLRHPLGWTALQVAAINGKVEAVKALLECGAEPNCGDDFVNVYRTAIEKGLHSIDGNPLFELGWIT